MNQIFISTNGEKRGPYVLSQIQSMWNSGAITADSLYWGEGMEGGRPILELFKGESETQEANTATAVRQEEPTRAASSKGGEKVFYDPPYLNELVTESRIKFGYIDLFLKDVTGTEIKISKENPISAFLMWTGYFGMWLSIIGPVWLAFQFNLPFSAVWGVSCPGLLLSLWLYGAKCREGKSVMGRLYATTSRGRVHITDKLGNPPTIARSGMHEPRKYWEMFFDFNGRKDLDARIDARRQLQVVQEAIANAIAYRRQRP